MHIHICHSHDHILSVRARRQRAAHCLLARFGDVFVCMGGGHSPACKVCPAKDTGESGIAGCRHRRVTSCHPHQDQCKLQAQLLASLTMSSIYSWINALKRQKECAKIVVREQMCGRLCTQRTWDLLVCGKSEPQNEAQSQCCRDSNASRGMSLLQNGLKACQPALTHKWFLVQQSLLLL